MLRAYHTWYTSPDIFRPPPDKYKFICIAPVVAGENIV
jgi:hypothetical protein